MFPFMVDQLYFVEAVGCWVLEDLVFQMLPGFDGCMGSVELRALGMMGLIDRLWWGFLVGAGSARSSGRGSTVGTTGGNGSEVFRKGFVG
jgi:hypothetical protein